MTTLDGSIRTRDWFDGARRAGGAIALATRPVAPPSLDSDPDLTAQFDARVRHMFVLLDDAIAERPVLGDLRHALHRLAGTAAFFGKAELGTVASDLDGRLGDPACATAEFLEDARAALRRTAQGKS